MEYVWQTAVDDKVRLATLYYRDGAIASGATLLREAAELLDTEYLRRMQIIQEATEG